MLLRSGFIFNKPLQIIILALNLLNDLNPKAKLKYKVGLATSSELNIMGNQSVNSSPVNFWILSPHGIINNYWGDGLIKYVSTNGYILDENPSPESKGIRPVISIKSGIKYFSGNGSMESPYIIN